MGLPRVDLTAPDLFGNDAAEDEHDDVFDAYALDRGEVGSFVDDGRRICVARAFKGEGKSALLRLVRSRLMRTEPAPLVVRVTGKSISPAIASDDTDQWVRGWKQALLLAVARELGTRVGMAWKDDAISLLEEAERAGFRQRSLIGSIADRLKSSAIPIERTRPELANPEKLIQRWTSRDEELVWVLVDDIDENFKNTPLFRAKVASFFVAARDIVASVPQLRLRLAVRPNIWTTLSLEYESLSKVEQYNIDLRWSEAQIRDLLAARIRGYLTRTAQWDDFCKHVGRPNPRPEDVIAVVFESPVEWARHMRPAHVPLVTLSRRRPRWVIERNTQPCPVS